MDHKDLEYEFKFVDADHFMRYFIVEGASMIADKLGKKIDQIWPEMFVDDETVKWKLKVQLNGVELPVVEVFKLMDSAYEKMVTEKAIELVNDRIGDVAFIVDDMVDLTQDKVKDLFHDIKNKTFEEDKDD